MFYDPWLCMTVETTEHTFQPEQPINKKHLPDWWGQVFALEMRRAAFIDVAEKEQCRDNG